MGFRFRKSLNLGKHFRINLSKSGVGYSFGVKGLRFTRTAKGNFRTTATLPGTGISYVQESKIKESYSDQTTSYTSEKRVKNNKIILITGILIILIMIFGAIFYINYYNNRQSNFTNKELLTIPEHPVVFESAGDAKKFYNDISDSRVRVVSSTWFSRKSNELSGKADENVLLYFSEDSNADQLNYFIISIPPGTFEEETTLEKSLIILTEYLPQSFLDLYSTDASYSYGDENTTVYVYACRKKQDTTSLPNYYSIYISHYSETGYWKIETDCSAYGDRGLDWINNYSNDWSIDLSQYFQQN